ncbi:MAG: hypothetical protein LBU61_06960, partial [Coriobacteriales bacterium]|nr:hypothetical protein [Coriobacteriales bacterium]
MSQTDYSNRIRRASQIIWIGYLIAIVLLVVVLIGSVTADRHNVNYHWTALRVVDSATLSINGGEKTVVSLPLAISPVKAKDEITLTCQVNTVIYDNMLFQVSGASLDIYIDDILYISTGQPGSFPDFQKTPSPQISMLDLPTEDGIKDFRFVYTVAETTNTIF